MASSSSSPASTDNPLLYACIAHNTTILTEHLTTTSSQVSSLSSVILPKISHATPSKQTYTHGQHFVHYIASAPSEYESSSSSSGSGNNKASKSSGGDGKSAGNLTYLVIARSTLGQRIPFGLLLEAKSQFLREYPPASTDFSSMPAYGCGAFNSTLKRLLVHHGTSQEGQRDALKTVKDEMDDVRNIMTENIERVLERGERIDLLVDKTDRLGGNARDFRVRSSALQRRMWWKKTRVMVLLVVTVLVLMWLFVGFGCGLPAWGKCLHHS